MLFSLPIDSLAASGAILGDVWTDAVMPVVDTLGAGDSYIAGFLHAALLGKPIPERMRAGSENAAVTIGYVGAW